MSDMGTMVRTQVQLERDLAADLKKEAAARGVSQAEIIRNCLRAHLSQTRGRSREEIKRRALAASGVARGGPTDIARRHDDYLLEAYEK